MNIQRVRQAIEKQQSLIAEYICSAYHCDKVCAVGALIADCEPAATVWNNANFENVGETDFYSDELKPIVNVLKKEYGITVDELQELSDFNDSQNVIGCARKQKVLNYLNELENNQKVEA